MVMIRFRPVFNGQSFNKIAMRNKQNAIHSPRLVAQALDGSFNAKVKLGCIFRQVARIGQMRSIPKAINTQLVDNFRDAGISRQASGSSDASPSAINVIALKRAKKDFSEF